MLLQSIKLINFRQFRNEQITFADGSNGKNVTIILGENGTGKTTFAQAFFWCLYGETEFSDKIMLNRLVANDLVMGQSADVAVELRLKHGDSAYTLTRRQTYTKDSSGNVKGNNAVFNILRRDKSGNTTPIKPTLRESEVKSILPKELSRYFFFDGERIERMSKDISTHKKATEFADAVRSLLGLKGIESALRHLNPVTKTSVIGIYNNSYNASSNSKIQEYSKIIDDCNATIEKLTARIEELDQQIETAQTRRQQKTEELKQYEDSEKLQLEREQIQKAMNAANKTKSNMVKAICNDFNSNIGSYLSLWMIQKSLHLLQDKDFTGKDIPHMHEDTIDYLVSRGRCICGTHLDVGSMAYEKVVALKNFLPPKSLSSNIADFRKSATRRVSTAQQYNLQETIAEHLSIISTQEDDMTNYAEELHAIDEKLSGEDIGDKVKAINKEIQFCTQTISSSNKERDKCNNDMGAAYSTRSRAISKRGELALLDDKNKKIEIYKAYTERIYNELVTFYRASEKEMRTKLEQTINDIFLQIYEGGLSLEIDEKYRIHVHASARDESFSKVETSTAQSISVIFAFIAGIIKLARDNRVATGNQARLLSSEPYPLVMDAPLSAFDKRRIKTVCSVLPEVAEQIVIFIKDTDGELAEEHMGDKIGSRHRFEKINEFETHLV